MIFKKCQTVHMIIMECHELPIYINLIIIIFLLWTIKYFMLLNNKEFIIPVGWLYILRRGAYFGKDWSNTTCFEIECLLCDNVAIFFINTAFHSLDWNIVKANLEAQTYMFSLCISRFYRQNFAFVFIMPVFLAINPFVYNLNCFGILRAIFNCSTSWVCYRCCRGYLDER